jgi:hypothetical protein
MKAIKTVYHGPGNVRGSRISASDEDGNRITIPYPDHAGMGMEAHAVAAKALCEKMGWDGKWYGGGLKNCYVFVCDGYKGACTFQVDKR